MNGKPARIRADAQRNIDALLQAAAGVFMESGVDAPVREIAERAGVGIGTIYRHFPHRADLVAAVFRNEIDACTDAATTLATEHPPLAALEQWIHRYVAFVATKRGLSKALHSGDPTFEGLQDYFEGRVVPALQVLLDAASAAGDIRPHVEARDMVYAISSLCMRSTDDDFAQRMVGLLVDGLRYQKSP